MSLFAWIIVGLIAGAIAKVVMPGGQSEPGGWLGTMVLGIVGAVVGGFLSSTLLGGGGASGINLGSILVSVLGACVFIAILRFVKK